MTIANLKPAFSLVNHWTLWSTVHLKWTAGHVFFSVFNHNYVLALFSRAVRHIVVVAALMADVDALTGTTRTVHRHVEHVVA